jgi:hypothetical protein
MNKTVSQHSNVQTEAIFYSARLYTVDDNGCEIMKLLLMLIICSALIYNFVRASQFEILRRSPSSYRG